MRYFDTLTHSEKVAYVCDIADRSIGLTPLWVYNDLVYLGYGPKYAYVAMRHMAEVWDLLKDSTYQTKKCIYHNKSGLPF